MPSQTPRLSLASEGSSEAVSITAACSRSASLAFPIKDAFRDGSLGTLDRSRSFGRSASRNVTLPNERPFAKSAARRESIKELGSIKSLKQQFLEQGLAAADRPMTRGLGAPALGHGAQGMLHPRSVSDSLCFGTATLCHNAETSNSSQDDETMSEGTAKSSEAKAAKKVVEIDLTTLQEAMLASLCTCRRVWELPDTSDTAHSNASSPGTADVSDLVSITMTTLRAVQKYLTALPPQVVDSVRLQSSDAKMSNVDSPLRRAPSSFSTVRSKDTFRRRSSMLNLSSTFNSGNTVTSSASHTSQSQLPFETTSQMRQRLKENLGTRAKATESPSSRPDLAPQKNGTSELAGTSASPSNMPPDPTAKVRSRALEVQELLDSIQRGLRKPQRRCSMDDQASTPSRVRQLLRFYSRRRSESDDDEENDDENELLEGQKQASQLQARKLDPSDLLPHRKIISSYLQTVDDLVRSIISVEKAKGYEHSRLKAGSDQMKASKEAGEGKDALLPKWARQNFEGDLLARAQAILTDLLPEQDLVSAWEPDAFLLALSDGQLLCMAFNVIVEMSNRPWGYIEPSTIHDVKKEEGELRAQVKDGGDGNEGDDEDDEETNGSLRPGRPFRRRENLLQFCAAVRRRYGVRKVIESKLGVNPDMYQIALYHDGWQEAFSNLLGIWVDAVVEEKRSAA